MPSVRPQKPAYARFRTTRCLDESRPVLFFQASAAALTPHGSTSVPSVSACSGATATSAHPRSRWPVQPSAASMSLGAFNRYRNRSKAKERDHFIATERWLLRCRPSLPLEFLVRRHAVARMEGVE